MNAEIYKQPDIKGRMQALIAERDVQIIELVEPEPKPKRGIDWSHLRSLGHIAGNPFYENTN